MMKYQVLFLGPNADFWRGWQREGEGLTLEQAEMHAQECMDVVDAGGRICVVARATSARVTCDFRPSASG
jgi:hypothetical protein